MSATAREGFTQIPRGFRDVDAHQHSDEFATYLKKVANLLQAEKGRRHDLLAPRPGQSLLDVGCGQGQDVRALLPRVAPAGQVVGIDLSEQLIEAARQGGMPAGATFLVADAHALPFLDNTFDGALVERTLQHVHDPVQVLSEMSRVVRPGGVLVASEPDWETVTIDASDRGSTRALLHELSDHQIRDGWIGRQLTGHLTRLGLTELEVHPVTLVLRSLDAAFDILGITDADSMSPDWLDDLHTREAEGSFFASVTGFTVKGRVPQSGPSVRSVRTRSTHMRRPGVTEPPLAVPLESPLQRRP